MSNISKCVVKQTTLLAKEWKTTKMMDGKLSSRAFLSLCAGTVVNLMEGQWAGESGNFSELSEFQPCPPGLAMKVPKLWRVDSRVQGGMEEQGE